MATHGNEGAAAKGEVSEVDESVLRDLESRYAEVACPVHGEPPSFELAPDGSVVERFCCPALLSIVRELQIAAGERPPPSEGEDEEVRS
jgi:hypothetical protein